VELFENPILFFKNQDTQTNSHFETNNENTHQHTHI